MMEELLRWLHIIPSTPEEVLLKKKQEQKDLSERQHRLISNVQALKIEARLFELRRSGELHARASD